MLSGSPPTFLPPPFDELTRRGLLAGAAGSAVLLVAGCGGDDATAGGSGRQTSGQVVGPTTFTDDRGVDVVLPPDARVVAYEDAAAGLLPYGVELVGVFGTVEPEVSPWFGAYDLARVESVGAVYGEVNLEALAGLRPDVVVVSTWPPEGEESLRYSTGITGFKDEAQFALVEKIAPVVAVQVNRPQTEVFARFRDLARALGADLEAEAVVRAESGLLDARERVRAVTAARPELTVLATYVGETGFSMGHQDDGWPDLQEYESLGVRLANPRDSFDGVSWENVAEVDADVILVDSRPPVWLDENDSPVWDRLPAVRAGQLGEFWNGAAYDIAFFARHLEDLAELLERSEDVTV